METLNKAKMIDVRPYLQAGINPKNGLPIKMESQGQTKPALKQQIKTTLRILDEQDAVNRYVWHNLPDDLDGQFIERIIYYQGQAILFYDKTLNKFYFLPYALNGSIDVYGRELGISPVLMGSDETTTEKRKVTSLESLLTSRVLKPEYSVVENVTSEIFENACVILKDYTPQRNFTILSRGTLQDPILDAMAEAFPMARTNLIANSGCRGVRVPDEDASAQVKAQSKAMTKAVLEGDPIIPITSAQEFQELTGETASRSEEYLMYMQALDNYRLSLYGLNSGGVFQKKSHMLEAEQEMNSVKAKATYQDGLTIRQKFCNIVNSIWDLGIWCEASESALGDKDLDGEAIDGEDNTVNEVNNVGDDNNG